MQRKMSKRLFSILCAAALVATLMSTLFISVSAAAGDINDVDFLGNPTGTQFVDYVRVMDGSNTGGDTAHKPITAASQGGNVVDNAWTFANGGEQVNYADWATLLVDIYITNIDTVFAGSATATEGFNMTFNGKTAGTGSHGGNRTDPGPSGTPECEGELKFNLQPQLTTGWNRVEIPLMDQRQFIQDRDFVALANAWNSFKEEADNDWFGGEGYQTTVVPDLERLFRLRISLETGLTLESDIRFGNAFLTDKRTPMSSEVPAPAPKAGGEYKVFSAGNALGSVGVEWATFYYKNAADQYAGFDASGYGTLEMDIYVEDITKVIVPSGNPNGYVLPVQDYASLRLKVQTGANYPGDGYVSTGDGSAYFFDVGKQIVRSGWNHIVVELPDQRNSTGALYTAHQAAIDAMNSDPARVTNAHNVGGAQLRSIGNIKFVNEVLGSNLCDTNIRIGNIYFGNQKAADVTFVDAAGAALSGAAMTEATNAIDVQLGHKADTYNVTVTNPAGKMLKGGMLYYSENIGGSWSAMRPLAGRVNSRFYDGVDSDAQAANENTSVSFYNITAAGNTTGEIKIFADFVADTFTTAAITTNNTSDNALKVFGVSTRDEPSAGLQFGTRAYRNITVDSVDYKLVTCGTMLVKASTVSAWTNAQSAKDWVAANTTSGEFKKVPTTSLLDRCDEYVDFSARIINITDELKNTEYIAVPYANYVSDDGSETVLDIVAYTPSNSESYNSATAKKNF